MDDSDDVFERFGDALKVAHVAPLEMVGSKVETAYVVSALREGAAEVTANEARRARDQNPFHPTLRCSETVGPSSPPRVSEVAWSAQMRSALPSGHLLRGYVLTVSAVVPDPSQGHEEANPRTETVRATSRARQPPYAFDFATTFSSFSLRSFSSRSSFSRSSSAATASFVWKRYTRPIETP